MTTWYVLTVFFISRLLGYGYCYTFIFVMYGSIANLSTPKRDYTAIYQSQNWLIFLYYNGNVCDVYESVMALLIKLSIYVEAYSELKNVVTRILLSVYNLTEKTGFLKVSRFLEIKPNQYDRKKKEFNPQYKQRRIGRILIWKINIILIFLLLNID